MKHNNNFHFQVLSTLKEHNSEIEEAWHDLEENEAEVAAKLKSKDFCSVEEKLALEQEMVQLQEARRLLQVRLSCCDGFARVCSSSNVHIKHS